MDCEVPKQLAERSEEIILIRLRPKEEKMFARIHLFALQILLIEAVAVTTLIYLEEVSRRFKRELNSLDWAEKNRWKLSLLIGLPLEWIWAPFGEELFFRAPLIVAFPALSRNAWIAILVSAALFATLHWFNLPVLGGEIFEARKNGVVSDDPKEATSTLLKEKTVSDTKIPRVAMRIAKVVATFPMGVIAGYFGIKLQSVWAAVGIHFLANTLLPLVLMALTFIILSAYMFWDDNWCNLRSWYRRRRDPRNPYPW